MGNADAEVERAKYLLHGFLRCPEIADAGQENMDEDTIRLERETRQFLWMIPAPTPLELAQEVEDEALEQLIAGAQQFGFASDGDREKLRQAIAARIALEAGNG